MNFDKIKVLTFATYKYKNSRDILNQHLSKIGVTNLINCSDFDLPKEFKEKHSELFNHGRGYGYWIWKPYLIKKTLLTLKPDEILLYMDCADIPYIGFFNFLNNHFEKNDYLILNQGYNHGEWTKSDCFFFMNCDSEEYYDHVQVEAGVMAFKNTTNNLKLIDDWYTWMNFYQILNDNPNISNLKNKNNFKDHRHDQSILTNLVIKNKLQTYFITKNLIKYNVNQP